MIALGETWLEPDEFASFEEEGFEGIQVNIGSGKGVTSVKTINQIIWKRKSLKFYNILSKYYSTAVNNYPRYK